MLLHYVFILTFILATLTGIQGQHILRKIVGRIIGGEPTTIQAIPYQCSLWNGTVSFCGGALISNEWVVTAAHCIGKMGKYQVRINSTVSTSGGTLLDVISDIKHPFFNEIYSYDYDVALINIQKCDSNMHFARWPSCNEKKCVDEVDNMIQVSGWGVNNITNENDKNVLQKVRVPITNLNQCKELYKLSTDITPRMFCAGYIKEGGKDSCQGDSGGPVTCDGSLVGVVSAGTASCALSGIPSIYTDLMDENIQKWIQDTTGIIRNCTKPGVEEQPQPESPTNTTSLTPIVTEEITPTTVGKNNNIVVYSKPIDNANKENIDNDDRRNSRYGPSRYDRKKNRYATRRRN